jgi:site-specific DNA-methyltransferase (adenine-specific)
MEIVIKKINELKEYENNPRLNDSAVDAVAESIKQFGFKVPIVIDTANTIIAGHTRLNASIKLGLSDVPCIIASDLNEEQIKAFRLVDNKTSELSSWDIEKLELELADIDMDLSIFGFDNNDTEEPDTYEDDFDPNEHLDEIPYSKLGDIYILGKHRLMCGDSTSLESMNKLLENKQVDLIVTDPPYNVDVGSKGDTNDNFDNRRIKNDNMNSNDFLIFLTKVFSVMHDVMRTGCSYYVCHASSSQLEFDHALQDNNLKPRQQLIWNKNTLVLGRQSYQWKHECIFYGWREGSAHYFIDDRTKTTVIDSPSLDFKNMKKEELITRLEDIYSNYKYTVLNYEKPSKCDLHPTMKPISLLSELIKNSSKQGEVILDMFGGSGSTLIACEELNRISRLMELDEKFVDVIVKRYVNLKGNSDNCYLIRNGEKVAVSDIQELVSHINDIN